MTAPTPPQPNRKSLWETSQKLARAAAEELASGADQLRQAGLKAPPESARLRQFIHGFALPFVIARTLWRDAAGRRQYLRVVLAQGAMVLALGLWFAWASDSWREDVEEPEVLRARAVVRTTEAGRMRELAKASDATLQPFVTAAVDQERRARAAAELEEATEEAADADERQADRTERTASARQALERAREGEGEGEAARERLAKAQRNLASAEEAEGKARAGATKAHERLERAQQAVKALGPASPRAERRVRDPNPVNVEISLGSGLNYQVAGGDDPSHNEADPPEALAEQVAGYIADDLLDEKLEADRLSVLRQALRRSAQTEERRAEALTEQAEKIEARGGRLIHQGLLFWAALLTALYVVQTVIIWLSRDYHDVIEHRASLAIGIPPEAAPERPRVRLNLRWLRKKLRRRWRGFVLFALGTPFIWLATLPLPYSDRIASVLSAAWFSYWWMVWSAAKTSASWDETPRDPWFLRGWTYLTTRVAPLRVLMPHWYGRLWRRQLGEVVSPATCVERQPWAMAGLALSRGIGNLPFLKVFLRPFFPVAAAQLISERRVVAPPPVPAHPEVEAARGD